LLRSIGAFLGDPFHQLVSSGFEFGIEFGGSFGLLVFTIILS